MHQQSDEDAVQTWFWEVIARADRSREKLHQILSAMTKEEVYRFAFEFLDASAQLQDVPFTHYVMPGASEDNVEVISWWVVSQGRDCYTSICREPGRMPKRVDINDPTILYGVAEDLYGTIFGELDIWGDYFSYAASPLYKERYYSEQA